VLFLDVHPHHPLELASEIRQCILPRRRGLVETTTRALQAQFLTPLAKVARVRLLEVDVQLGIRRLARLPRRTAHRLHDPVENDPADRDDPDDAFAVHASPSRCRASPDEARALKGTAIA
jgi:hypothetical protein